MKRNKFKKYLHFLRQALEILFYQIIAIGYQNRVKFQNLWLFCERGYEAQDNAFLFFEYLQSQKIPVNSAYLINSPDDQKNEFLKQTGRVIRYNSFEHKIAFCLCKKAFSTHIGFIEPWNIKLYKLLSFRSLQYVFLQHGITYQDISKYVKKSISCIDIFIVSSEYEFQNIQSPAYGFTENEIKITGFARFDRLINESFGPTKDLMFMPTWRREIESERDFLNSNYYQTLRSLIENPEFHEILGTNGMKLKLILHPEFQKYHAHFKLNSKVIKIVQTENSILQNEIISSSLLITDYSSVFFDFAYVGKPIIFYKFDDHSNYKHSDFDFSEVGELVSSELHLIETVDGYIDTRFEVPEKYKNFANSFFKYIDNKNCDRILKSLRI